MILIVSSTFCSQLEAELVKSFVVTQLKKKQFSEDGEVKEFAASPPPQTPTRGSRVKGARLLHLYCLTRDPFPQTCSGSKCQSTREPRRRLWR